MKEGLLSKLPGTMNEKVKGGKKKKQEGMVRWSMFEHSLIIGFIEKVMHYIEQTNKLIFEYTYDLV